MKNTIHVVAAVIVENQKVLCCQRKKEVPYPLKWEFPGGKIEDGETKEEALKREIKEELNVSIDIKDYIMKVDHEYKEFYLIMDMYLCTIRNGQIENHVHHDIKWVSKSYINKLDWLEADLPIIEKISELL